MKLDFANRELTIKLVYYGPALSGKTTNLMALHRIANPAASGRLMTLETRDDRTLFFDLLPLTFHGHGALSVRIKVFTVPGQVIHASTRRLVVRDADGIAFVADSRVSEIQNNNESFLDLGTSLGEHGITLQQMPLVIQFNKRDLPGVRGDAEIAELASRGREPVFLAIATQGVGVTESFLGLLHLTWAMLEAEHEVSQRFDFDSAGFFSHVAQSLGEKRPLSEILSQAVGGALDVLTPEAGQ